MKTKKFSLFPSSGDYMSRINFLNPTIYPETLEAYEGQRNPELLVELAKAMNAQSERLEFLFMDIVTNPKHQSIEYKDILPWRQRVDYLKSQGQARAAKRLEIAEAAKEAKSFDDDEEFQSGYKEFLASEFDLS